MFQTQQLTPHIRRIHVPSPTSGNAGRLPDPALGEDARTQVATTPISTFDTLEQACAGLPLALTNLGYDPDGSVAIRVELAADDRLYGACDADAHGLQRRGERVQLVNELHPRGRHLLATPIDEASDPSRHAAELEIGGGANYAEVLMPFVMSSGGWGIYISNAHHDAVLDLGASDPDALTYRAPGGDADVYIISGGDPSMLSRSFTKLCGRQPMPPVWTLGYIQSRFGYRSFDEVHEIVARFEREQLPLHGIVFDVYWLRDHVDLQWDPVHFPDPTANLARLADAGVRSVVITEPGTKTDASNFAAGAARDAWAVDADGALFDSDQWYTHRGIGGYRPVTDTPGALLNVFREDAADWWYEQHEHLIEAGVDAWWLDLNEPEDVTPDVRFRGCDWPARRDELDGMQVRNLYAIAQQRAFARRDRRATSRRPFLLTRSASAGSQRYGASPWSGDIGATWDDLRAQPRMALTAGMCGLPMMGSDVGGFVGTPGGELYARWVQMGAVLPVLRAHGCMSPREPWSQDAAALAAVRPALRLRAGVLPSIATWVHLALEAGEPYVRPMLLGPLDAGQANHARIHDACVRDERFADVHDQWFFGPLLAAPVLHEGQDTRTVLLPEGTDWIDVWSGTIHEGGGSTEVPVDAASLPVFASAGTVLVTDPAPLDRRGHNWPPAELLAHAFAGDGSERATALIRVDDGITRLHEQGAYCLQHIAIEGTDSLHVERLRGAWPASRIRLGGAPLRLHAERLG